MSVSLRSFAPERATIPPFRVAFQGAPGWHIRAVEAPTLRILAVDDDVALARMMAQMLKTDGHCVTVVGSAEEAVERLVAEPFDLVISDLAMDGGMNGWQLAELVRAEFPGLRFVLATGWGAAIEPAEARTRGVAAVLAKPFRLADLRRVVSRH